MLASASPARRRVLLHAGFAPEVMVSGVDEDIEAASTDSLVGELAARKAVALVRTPGTGSPLPMLTTDM